MTTAKNIEPLKRRSQRRSKATGAHLSRAERRPRPMTAPLGTTPALDAPAGKQPYALANWEL